MACDGIRDVERSRGLGDVYKRQDLADREVRVAHEHHYGGGAKKAQPGVRAGTQPSGVVERFESRGSHPRERRNSMSLPFSASATQAST